MYNEVRQLLNFAAKILYYTPFFPFSFMEKCEELSLKTLYYMNEDHGE